MPWIRTWRDLKCRKCKSPDLDYGTWKDGDEVAARSQPLSQEDEP